MGRSEITLVKRNGKASVPQLTVFTDGGRLKTGGDTATAGVGELRTCDR